MIGRYVTASPLEAMVYSFCILAGTVVLSMGIVWAADWLYDKKIRREIERSRRRDN